MVMEFTLHPSQRRKALENYSQATDDHRRVLAIRWHQTVGPMDQFTLMAIIGTIKRVPSHVVGVTVIVTTTKQ